ncbi:MAG TPA: type II toxin-antitoxin system Phd/YefM family antitoxin [Bryobacteraceae bacterium]|nr:type II toxin-antitoxin system Phd/YefM family antitoxin [Bryobacteraceae bacterium]
MGAKSVPIIDLTKDIHSLSAFKRNSLRFLRRLRESGGPMVLTVNGKAEFVLQDVASYQRLREQAGASRQFTEQERAE